MHKLSRNQRLIAPHRPKEILSIAGRPVGRNGQGGGQGSLCPPNPLMLKRNREAMNGRTFDYLVNNWYLKERQCVALVILFLKGPTLHEQVNVPRKGSE